MNFKTTSILNIITIKGKHKLYCVKWEASCYPNGEICNWTKWAPGATADVTLFRRNLAWHKKTSKKSSLAQLEVDDGEGTIDHPCHHAILLDKGYIGVEEVIRLVILVL